MEPTGVALGAIALIPVAYKAFIKCLELLDAFRSDDDIFSKWARDLFLQQELFTRECKALLLEIVSSDTAEQMLDDEKHPQWKNQDFSTWCAANMPKSTEAALRDCLETLIVASQKLAAANGFKGPAAILNGALEPSMVHTLTPEK